MSVFKFSWFFTHSLRLALLNEAKEVRAAGLRALRYLIRDTAVLQKVLRLQVDYLIARWDSALTSEMETTGHILMWWVHNTYFWNLHGPFEGLCFSRTYLVDRFIFPSLAGCGETRRTWLMVPLCSCFRCIDIQQSNEGERTQALRLVRKVRYKEHSMILF